MNAVLVDEDELNGIDSNLLAEEFRGISQTSIIEGDEKNQSVPAGVSHPWQFIDYGQDHPDLLRFFSGMKSSKAFTKVVNDFLEW